MNIVYIYNTIEIWETDKVTFFYQIYKVWIKPEILSVQASKLMKYSCLYVYINCLHNWCFWKKIKKKSRKNFFLVKNHVKSLPKKRLFFRFFFFLLWVRNFWETDKLKKYLQKWIQKFTKIILETSSVSISSKLVDIFGLKALCTKAWENVSTLKWNFNKIKVGLWKKN